MNITENKKSVFGAFVLLIILSTYSFFAFKKIFPIEEPFFYITLILIITSIIIERFYTPPRDVIANSITAIVIVIPFIKETGEVAWYLVLIIAILLLILSIIDTAHEKKGKMQENKKLLCIHFFVTNFGKSRDLFTFIVAISLIPFIKRNSLNTTFFFILILYLVLKTPVILKFLPKLYENVENIVLSGFVTGSNSPMNLTAKLSDNSNLSVSDKFKIIDKCNLCEKNCDIEHYGKIINLRTAIEQNKKTQTANLILYGTWNGDENCPELDKNPFGLLEMKRNITEQNEIFRIKNFENLSEEIKKLPIFENEKELIGFVEDKSKIKKIKVNLLPNKWVQQGKVIGIQLSESDKIIYYQVINVIAEEEKEAKLPFGKLVAEATQIGEFIKEENKFILYETTPYVNTPVFLARYSEIIEKPDVIGNIPGTDLPVKVDFNSMVVYHTAILGTTGSGKTSIVKTLQDKFDKKNIKTLIIDTHNEYNNEYKMNIEFEEFKEREAINEFFNSSEIEKYAEKIDGKNEEVLDYLKELNKGNELLTLADVDIKHDSFSSHSKKGKKRKKILRYFLDEWLPFKYLTTLIKNIDNNGESYSNYEDILKKWMKCEIDDKCLLFSLGNLSPDEQRFILGNILGIIYRYLEEEKGIADIIDETNDPKAEICLILEEAHIFAPESGYSIGQNDIAKKMCQEKLRNIALRGRKYGFGMIVISQRSAFLDKGILSQCNTSFALKTVSSNDKKVFKDFMPDEYVDLVMNLNVPPENPEAIFVGKASSSKIPLIINYKLPY
ncbi:MAG: ATP-binding protein [Elusimicrobiota bacterium]